MCSVWRPGSMFWSWMMVLLMGRRESSRDCRRNSQIACICRNVPESWGLGTAYIHGFRWGLDRGYQYLFEMDADFSHDPNDLERLLAACETEGYDVAIGSRYVRGRKDSQLAQKPQTDQLLTAVFTRGWSAA